MIAKKRMTAPISSVDADEEQPKATISNGIIANSQEQINQQAEKSPEK